MDIKRWENYFLTVAETAAAQSKDPNTKVGCVITDKYDRIISTGFNGLPRGIKDTAKILNDRDTKLMIILHAEVNAILFAKRDLVECILYSTHIPCSSCASLIIQTGIKQVIVGTEVGKELTERWNTSLELSKKIFKEAGVKIKEVSR